MKKINGNQIPFRVSADRKATTFPPHMVKLAENITEFKKRFLVSLLQEIWPSLIRDESLHMTSQFR